MSGRHYDAFGSNSAQGNTATAGMPVVDPHLQREDVARRDYMSNMSGNQMRRVNAGASRVNQAVRDINEGRFEQPTSSFESRRVNAASQGLDISQRYDAFGNNSFSSADNPWAAFFGSPTAPWKTTSYDKYDRHNYNLPEAYVGKNDQISQTIDELIYTDETFYTSVLLPFNFTDAMGISWDKWVFNEHFTGIVPEQGVSRLVSSHRESQSESFIRRGLAAMFEHGFMSTPQGRANYFLTLAQIARAVSETTNFGVIYAYLTCHNYNKQWEEKHGYFRKQTLRELLERENFMWAIAIKTEFGMEKLDAQIVEWMNRYRVSADTWILPPKPAMYLRLVPEEKVYYYKAGQNGPDNVNLVSGAGRPHEANAPNKRLSDIVEPYAVFKKNNVYLTRTYHVERTGPIDLMTRVSSVGEYFKIVQSRNSCEVAEGFMSCFNETRIYDEENDTGYTVQQIDALKYSQVFDEDGSPKKMNLVDPSDAQDLKQVFWLRNAPTESGANNFVPIDYLGDIDPAFMPVDAVANLARTAIASAIPVAADRERIVAALEAGRLIINKLASDPLTVAGATADLAGVTDADFEARTAGRVTYEGLEQIASVPAGGLNAANAEVVNVVGAYLRALQQVSLRVGGLFGGGNNIFLNPSNATPGVMTQAAKQARTLYENLINPRLVRVYRTAGFGLIAPVPTGVAARNLATIHATAVNGLLDPNAAGNAMQKVDAETVTRRALTPQELQEHAGFRALITGGGDLAIPSEATIDAILSFYQSHPRLSRAATVTALNEWIGKLRAAVANVMAAPLISSQAGGRAAAAAASTITATVLAVSEDNASVANLPGFALASRHNPMRISDGFGGSSDARRHGFRLSDMPIIKGLIANEVAEGGFSGAGGEQSQQSRRGGGSDLHDMFDDGSENIGTLFGSGSQRDEALAGIQARSGAFSPQVEGLGGSTVNVRFGTLAYNVDRLASLSLDELVGLVSLLYLGTPWRMETLSNFDAHNVMLPCGFLGFRVGMYDMALGIKCKAGGETGYTYFGHSDFMLSDDAVIKVHYGNFTHYGKSVVHRPEHVFIAYDIFPNRCLGGMGVMPYDNRSQYVPADQVAERDIFYVMVAFAETQFDKVMSMAGRFYTYMDAGMLDDEDPANRKLHYSTAPWYNRVWGWYNDEEVPVELDEPMYRMNNPGHNLTVWQGAQGSYNQKSGKHDRNIIRNKSPWGPNVTEGCKASRDGRMERVQPVVQGILGF